ncbi:MAG: hypothetical protein ACE5E7_07910 [Anaerolineae bacterium]
MKTAANIALALLIPLFIAVNLRVPAALAHEGVRAGPYLVTIGWEKEPVIAGERNAITIEITKDGQPVTGVANTLELTVLYAGRTYLGDLNPATAPGLYRVEIVPTVRGQYTVQLTGQIEGQEVNVTLEPEEVMAADLLQFPESSPETRELQATIHDFSAKLEAAYTLAVVSTVLAALGLVTAVVAVVRSRRSS